MHSESWCERVCRVVSAPVVISLVLLLVNDWHLKGAYGNGLTGKLSDFAGLFLLSLLVFSLWPGRKWLSALAICAGFVWWKSPLSGPLITLMNSVGPAGFGRVVDYSDLMALVMVAVAWRVAVHRARGPIRFSSLRRAVALPLLVLCSFSMLATSYATFGTQLEMEPLAGERGSERVEALKAIDEIARRNRFRSTPAEHPEAYGFYVRRSGTLEYIILEDGSARLWVGTRSAGRSARIANSLKKGLERVDGRVTIEAMDGQGMDGLPEITDRVEEIFSQIAQVHGFEKDSANWVWRLSGEGWVDFSFRFQDADLLLVNVRGNDADGIRKIYGELTAALSEAFSDLEIIVSRQSEYAVKAFVHLEEAE